MPPAYAAPVDLPRPFGPFELQVRVGEGGMAEVFRAVAFGASGFEKTVALKLLREEFVGDPVLERMFLEEARLQACLAHRCLVQAHDAGTTDGRPWVRVEWMDGGDLATLLARAAPLPVPLACRVGAEVALGLHVLHAARDEAGRPLGLVHRDVTASNVLLSRLGEVKLGDFGIAKATRLREQTRGGVRKGTASAMSPEQVAGRPLSPASDVFSLATLVTELLTGRRPFDGESAVETMDRIREAKTPDLAGVPEGLRAPLAAAFALEPTERPAPLALREALLALAGDELALGAPVRGGA